MKKIRLTSGEYTKVDDDCFDELNQFKWTMLVRRGKNSIKYAMRSIDRKSIHKTYYLHREIMNAPKGTEVDHINGDGLDNRRCNLRIGTKNDNQRNTYNHRNGRLQGVNILVKKGIKYYQAMKNVDGKVTYLGSARSEEEAHLLWLMWLYSVGQPYEQDKE